MRSEEEILTEIKSVENGTLSGSTEAYVMFLLRKELREWQEANPSLLASDL